MRNILVGNHHMVIGSLAIIALVTTAHSQSPEDTPFHPYHVDFWVTGGILVGGVTAEKIGVKWTTEKSPITNAELLTLDRADLTAFDRWALNFDPSNMSYYDKLSDKVLAVIVALPVLTMLDHNIREDWLDVLLMYAETVTITNNMYLYSPFGPTFQTRLRPVVYYDGLGSSEVRMRGGNRNSLVRATTAAVLRLIDG